MKNVFFLLLITILGSCSGNEQKYTYIAPVEDTDTQEDIIKKAANVVPSERQLEWQKLEMTAFIHFGINTFYNQEWGHGNEDPMKFNPVSLDTDQWVKVIKDAGMKMVIITAKHHDGFCLWPSAYTEHSVKNSPWKNGKGDVVKDLAESCKKAGLKFGVYLSPWDRNSQIYGTEEYNDYFVDQLNELLTQYGKIDEVWFDGANGEGPNGKRQVYDWKRYYRVIRDLQPGATIAVMGPDVRWVGTESGYGRDTEWSVLPANNLDREMIAEISQSDAGFVPMGDKMQKDLGSREKLKNAGALVWYPSEVDVSIRPGWFYHANQDNSVKTPEKLLDIYYSSVGKNSLLLLNIPPDTRGLIHENDVETLKGFRKILDHTFKESLVNRSSVRRELYDNDIETSISLEVNTPLEINFERDVSFDRLLFQEDITVGQRIEKFHVEAYINEMWTTIGQGTTVGYKRILRTDRITTSKIRLIVDGARAVPAIAEVGIFMSPPAVQLNPSSGVFKDSIEIHLSADIPDAEIYYSENMEDPLSGFKQYKNPVIKQEAGWLRAYAKIDDKEGLVRESHFPKESYTITLANEASERFNGEGPITLMDGLTGSTTHTDGRWLGFEGNDANVTVDLGKEIQLREITLSFLQKQSSWIFAPEEVEIAVSIDGNSYKSHFKENFSTVKNDETERVEVKTNKPFRARFIRVKAKNIGTCPPWHDGDGGKAWLFMDEIKLDSPQSL